MANPTESAPSRKAAKAIDKPPKPYPSFPLSPANCGAWQKKINGKIHYFGKWGRVVDGVLTRIQEDGCWQDALKDYEAQKDDLSAGRRPRGKRSTPGANGEDDKLTVADLCNRFLTAKLRKQTAGEMGSRMFVEYKEITDLIVAAFGNGRRVDDLAADDFEELRATLAERWGPVRLGNAITRIKSVFKYGVDNALLDRAPRFGSEFKKPEKAVLRRHRAQNGEKMLEADKLRQLIEKADATFRAMLLLGVNAGFGNNDVATLPLSALDLERGWLSFPRPKTGIARRCPLWPETVAAIREALADRPKAKDKADAEIVFLQSSGRRWVRITDQSRTDNVSVHFTNLVKTLGMHRDGIGFYTLCHVFRTVADAARDPVAIDLIMGHTDPSMGGHYRERVEDSRLQAVAEHVHAWLFSGPSGNAPKRDPDVSDPSDRLEEVESRTQDSESDSPADSRPTLRLYVG
jgi:integrase